MKKIVLSLLVITGLAFATEVKTEVEPLMVGCKLTKLSEDISVLSCPTGDYKVIYEVLNGKRQTNSSRIVLLK